MSRTTILQRYQGAQALFLAVLSWGIVGSVGASEEPAARPQARAVLVVEAPEIDGRLDEAVWEMAEPLMPLTQVIPVTGATPSQRTVVRILRTEGALYLGVRCYDDHPDQIIAREMEEDGSIEGDDRVGFFLDTFHNYRSAYFFGVNPRGSRVDALVRYRDFEKNWDTIWQARARIDDQGWVVEVEIPFESISFDPENDAWGFNFYRVIRRLNERDRWTDIDINHRFGNMAEAGDLVGMLGARQGLGLDVVPALSVRRIDDEVEDKHEFDFKPGGDIFYNPIPSLTASFTANTDFADAAVDQFQVNLTRFALFYPETRPFFLRDATIFDFGGLSRNGRPFFSRRIGLVDGEEVPLLFGGKVTGTQGGVNFGILETWTGSGQGVGQKSLGVERVTLDVGRESSVGAIVTHGDPNSDNDNAMIGFDGLYRNSEWDGDKVIQARAWFQNSFTEGSDGLQAGWGGELSYPNDRVNWRIAYKELSEEFNPALGFVNRPNIRAYTGEYRFRLRPEWIRTVDFSAWSTVVTDRENIVRSGYLYLTPFDFSTPMGDQLYMGYLYEFQRPEEPFEIYPGVVIPVDSYSNQRFYWEYTGSRARPIALTFGGEVGSFYSGSLTQITPSLVLRPSPHVDVSLGYTGSFVNLEEGDFETHVLVARLNLMFNVDISWSTLVQWEHETGEVVINSRFRWIIVPGRELFLVVREELLAKGGGLKLERSMPVVKLRWTFRF